MMSLMLPTLFSVAGFIHSAAADEKSANYPRTDMWPRISNGVCSGADGGQGLA